MKYDTKETENSCTWKKRKKKKRCLHLPNSVRIVLHKCCVYECAFSLDRDRLVLDAFITTAAPQTLHPLQSSLINSLHQPPLPPFKNEVFFFLYVASLSVLPSPPSFSLSGVQSERKLCWGKVAGKERIGFYTVFILKDIHLTHLWNTPFLCLAEGSITPFNLFWISPE